MSRMSDVFGKMMSDGVLSVLQNTFFNLNSTFTGDESLSEFETC